MGRAVFKAKNPLKAARLRIEYQPLKRLVKWPRNPKGHNLSGLQESFSKFGFVDPIIIDETSERIVSGHGRVDSLSRMRGLSVDPPERIIKYKKDWLVPVIRGICFGDKRQAEGYLIASNQLTISEGFKDDALKKMLTKLQNTDYLGALGFGKKELQNYLRQINNGNEIEKDEIPKLLKKVISKLGDLYELDGKHKILCGNSTKAENVIRLMEGKKAVLMATDPPYGINIVKKEKVKPKGKLGFGKVGYTGTARVNYYTPIIGDDHPFDPIPFLNSASIIILFGANNYCDKLPLMTGWIVWDKGADTGTGPKFSDCELAWTNQNRRIKKFTYLWKGFARSGSKLIEGIKRMHPTQKPVALFAWLIEEFTAKNDLCYEPFLGSGSQLIAAEQLGRRCYGIDIEPRYVDVCIQRYLNLRPDAEIRQNGKIIDWSALIKKDEHISHTEWQTLSPSFP